MARDRMIVPIFIPHQGCPYRCVYCDQNRISGAQKLEDGKRLDRAFNQYLNSRPGSRLPAHREAAFYGGTFTALPRARQRFLLASVQNWIEQGWVRSIRLSTHPMAVDEPSLEFLKPFSVTAIELGIQSTDPGVLTASGRGDTPGQLAQAGERVKRNGFQLGLQLMMGLPGDSESKFQRTVDDVINWRPDFVRIYPALVMRGTALHAMYQRGEYRPWDLEKTVRALKTAVQRLDQAGIPVIRMGLHAEPSLHEGYVDGPHHPALRSLVESSLCLDQMVRLLDRAGVLPERVIFKVPLRRVSNYTGHCKANIKALKSRYPGKSFVFQPTAELSTLELNLHN